MLDVIRLGLSEPLPDEDRHAQFDLPAGPIEYRAAWDLQRRIHAEVVAGERPDTLLLLEHRPVYTAGKLTAEHERPRDGAEVVDIDRGGKITWHGPQQLVGYPIVKLPIPGSVSRPSRSRGAVGSGSRPRARRRARSARSGCASRSGRPCTASR
jgi:lipoyl(octanoyl) transferase